MKVIGLTGSVATGKTTVTHMFKKLGAKVYYDDVIVKNITFSKVFFPYFKKYFNDAIIDNQIDKIQLKNIIINDPNKLKILENLLHPYVNKKRELLILKHKLMYPNDIIIFESPLLFETGINKFFSKVISTYCTENTQIKRALDRNSLNKKELEVYLKNQLPLQDKMNKSDYIINTEAKLEDVQREVTKIYNQIKNNK